MRYAQDFSKFKLMEADDLTNLQGFKFNQLKKPSTEILLDGTSSSGKSAALKDLASDWCVLAVDSFYNLMYEEAGMEDFGNGDKPKLSEIYSSCPYGTKPDTEDFENAARWFMAQEAEFGKIAQVGLTDKNGKFGRAQNQDKIVYDDVQGTILEFTEPLWILVHAPIDHLILNIERRKGKDDRDQQGVFIGAYCFKYEARSEGGGVDPKKSWTRESVKEVLKGQDWVEEFLEKLGMVDDAKYWIYAKSQPEGEYDVIVNTRNTAGGQMSIDEVASQVKKHFKEKP